MSLVVREIDARSILTRTSGYLADVCSHSLQPYVGCSYGRSLCGISCYVQHSIFVTRGRSWGSFVDVKRNAAALYRSQAPRERRWARGHAGAFSIFLSSATDPFLPQERRFGTTRALLAAMCDEPPDTLIIQTHSHRVLDALPELLRLRSQCELRVHLSIESDRERLPGLPPPASSVARRIEAACALRREGIRTVVTVSPLLPIEAPRAFFRTLGTCADAVVIDHFIGGDGSAEGSRTLRTPLPAAMEQTLPGSSQLAYRDEIVSVALEILPGRAGVGADGFAGRMLVPEQVR